MAFSSHPFFVTSTTLSAFLTTPALTGFQQTEAFKYRCSTNKNQYILFEIKRVKAIFYKNNKSTFWSRKRNSDLLKLWDSKCKTTEQDFQKQLISLVDQLRSSQQNLSFQKVLVPLKFRLVSSISASVSQSNCCF